MQQEYLNDADYWAKHLRVAALHETIEKLEKRIAELESKTYCAYCGKEYPVDDDASEVGEHIKTCKKHPLFEAQQIINDQDKRITQQRKRIAELEGYNADQNTIINSQHKRIKELEKECAEIEIKVGEYQQYWIRQQRS